VREQEREDRYCKSGTTRRSGRVTSCRVNSRQYCNRI